jgi:hypothetical protein
MKQNISTFIHIMDVNKNLSFLNSIFIQFWLLHPNFGFFLIIHG